MTLPPSQTKSGLHAMSFQVITPITSQSTFIYRQVNHAWIHQQASDTRPHSTSHLFLSNYFPSFLLEHLCRPSQWVGVVPHLKLCERCVELLGNGPHTPALVHSAVVHQREDVSGPLTPLLPLLDGSLYLECGWVDGWMEGCMGCIVLVSGGGGMDGKSNRWQGDG